MPFHLPPRNQTNRELTPAAGRDRVGVINAARTDEWDAYFVDMRAYNRGLRRDKPRVGYQHGQHIATMPVEENTKLAVNLPVLVSENELKARRERVRQFGELMMHDGVTRH